MPNDLTGLRRARIRAVPLNVAPLAALLILLVPGGKACAGFVVLDFESLRQDDALQHFIGPVYQSQGFTLTAMSTNPGQAPDFSFFGTRSPFYPGDTSLFQHLGGQAITLTRSDGGTFNLNSIDLADVPGGDTHGNPVPDAPFPLTFTGTLADGGTVTATATVDSFPTIETFSFTGFNDLVAVSWFQGTGAPESPTHQFDNLAVEAVPEPSSLIRLSIGMAACVMWRLSRTGSRRRLAEG